MIADHTEMSMNCEIARHRRWSTHVRDFEIRTPAQGLVADAELKK